MALTEDTIRLCRVTIFSKQAAVIHITESLQVAIDTCFIQ